MKINNVKYLIRLDDGCPTMNRIKWLRLEKLLDHYDIKPLVGVIPSNNDPLQKINVEDPEFWNKVKNWENKGWSIALHGYDHCYISKTRGINPFWSRSEFAGIPLEIQKEKIRKGIEILNKHDIHPKYFFAPSHTYDENTLEALRQESDIRIISDSIGRKPFRFNDFIFIPQIIGHCTEIPIPGIWTFCLHPNGMTDEDFKATELFLSNNKNKFIGFDEINLSKISSKSMFDKIISYFFFMQRKIRGLK